jgi:oligoendopeptidase F
MDRRGFLQTTGLTTVAAIVGRTAVAAPQTETEDAPVKKLPARNEVNPADTWDLSSLYPNDEAWEKAFDAWQKQLDGYAAFPGKLGESADAMAKCIAFDLDISRLGDRLGNYAHLKTTEDQTNGTYQRMMGRFMQAMSRAAQASSFIRPEILAVPTQKMDGFLQDAALAPYKLLLTRIIRFKPHTLGANEERLLAMQTEMVEAAGKVFTQLNNSDIKFGAVKNEKGQQVELSHGSLAAFLESPDRKVRANAFHTYYAQYKAHEHTLAASLNASVQRDIFYAKARNYPSALEASLFPDNMPMAVYDNLVASVHRQFPALHQYYDVRRRKMGLKDIHFYDTYVPILAKLNKRHTWDQAVKVILTALQPLGSDYCGAIEQGLERDRWCDRYENRGKQSGAFSAGSFDGKPYILINFQPDVLDSVFTLAHEGGHSMHSYYSAKTQPYAYYDYVTFVAEVASTFNETLLCRHLLNGATDNKERAFLLNREIDSIKQTIFRQTMFAEFEKLTHASAESGEPLTLDRFKEIYGGLLKAYFGPDVVLDPDLTLECFRVPHFYRAFYVYKYATGMSAAIALAERVLAGGEQERSDYLNFLKGGCSKDPLDLLRGAGVDMEKPDRVDSALAHFGEMVKELDTLI